jgi:hypothetical protein
LIDETLIEVGRQLVRQMRMGVNESRAKRGVTQLDHGRAVGDRHARADGLDGLALDDHHPVCNHLV